MWRRTSITSKNMSRDPIHWNPHGFFERDGKPLYIVGTNYVARYICTNFWQDWRPDVIAKDLDNIAEAGLNAVRIPVHWEFAEPKPGVYNPLMLERFREFLRMAEERGLLVMPWFLVGVATQDYDVSWRDGASFFKEPMATYAENHLRTFVRRFKNRLNILCWDICDEPEWYSRHPGADPLPYTPSLVLGWVKRLYEAIKAEDPDRCVTLGFGHIASSHYGMNVRDMANVLDAMAVTAYPPNTGREFFHSFRNTYFLGWSVRFNDCAGKGVFTCEAPGWSHVAASEESIGRHFRVTLYSNLANGSSGVLPWVWNDFDRAIHHLPPLDKHTLEPYFGMAREDGSLKPSGLALSEFADFVRKVQIEKWMPVRYEVGILVPENYYETLPVSFSALFHSYIVCRQAGLFVLFVWEKDLTSFAGRTLFIPSVGGYRTSTWQRLAGWIRDGGTLYCSNSGPNQCNAEFNPLFGVEVVGFLHQAEPLTATRVTDCRLAIPHSLSWPGGRSLMVVQSLTAKICMKEDGDLPVLLLHPLGEGHALLLTYPSEQALEYLGPEDLGVHLMHRIYRAVSELTGNRGLVSCADPRIELDIRLRSGSDELLIIAINHSEHPVRATLDVRRDIIKCMELIKESPEVRGPGRSIQVELEGSGIAAYLCQ